MKSKEEILNFFDNEAALGFCTNEYALRLKWYFATYYNEYAQQPQPSGMRCEPEFIEYINKSRAAFVKHIHGMKWDTKLRTAVDDLLICFDQMKTRLSESSPAGAAEGASEGMAGAVKFAKFLADNDYRPGSGNKHWFKWNGMEVDETPLTLEQVYQIFASLSPGVEDNQTKKQ